jgi:glycosyltransferase involved in cell wall biosynthesis
MPDAGLQATKVSVVIPTYNRGHVVGEAIESALGQSHENLEVVVVDDGSTDDTAQRVGRLRDPRLRYLRREHAGVSCARNAGIASTSGHLVAFLDSDDLWKSEKLEAEIAALARHPTASGVFSDLEKHDGATLVPSFMRRTRVFSRLLADAGYPERLLLSSRALYLCLLQEVPIKTPALTVRRCALERVAGFDERWTSSEDWEFLLRFARTESLLYVDRPLAVIRVSKDSLRLGDQERGELMMLGLLAGERRRLADPEARRAAAAGIVERAKHLSWYYRDAGRRAAAMRTCLDALRVVWDVELLLRALMIWGPQNPRRYVARMLSPGPGSLLWYGVLSGSLV